ncbi:hypothetical protein [Burkholderia sp. ABCPW 11]|uniref:hypothetical protein n=1 Tax=Burkholderia sp. ABCPW 11 TaxID=1637859 RepID=UPI0012FD3C93|nr:hypothetical protein [Burkholderia sp. ABCPW 11]
MLAQRRQRRHRSIRRHVQKLLAPLGRDRRTRHLDECRGLDPSTGQFHPRMHDGRRLVGEPDVRNDTTGLKRRSGEAKQSRKYIGAA